MRPVGILLVSVYPTCSNIEIGVDIIIILKIK